MRKYVVLDKKVGETPLVCAEKWRQENDEYQNVPLAYAGRLDPMASGQLLVLIGDECKKQTEYHGLDKEYEFSVLFGISSDTADVLGRLNTELVPPRVYEADLRTLAKSLVGETSLPYPHFSSKTVQGKPLHTWTLEGRLNEIEIPEAITTIYTFEFLSLQTIPRAEIAATALEKIETIPPVTEARKALGNDFRRNDVRQDWHKVKDNAQLPHAYQIATFSCTASSGTYMRTLAEVLAKQSGTIGLAWHIHRTQIGNYNPVEQIWNTVYN